MAYKMGEDEPSAFVPTTICWLPTPLKPKRTPKSFIDIGHFVFLREALPSHERIWNMIELAVPPLLDRKFHIVNVSELIKESPENQHYFGVAIWFVLWNESYGHEYLNLILSKHNQYETATKSKQQDKLMLKWKIKVDDLLKSVKEVYHLRSAPKLGDNCFKAIEFILEPCILIQLPWKPVLLHQWLVASLFEVLMFERGSLEFRHWPLSGNIYLCAEELLTLVCKLKERIILGFVILFQQAAKYPKFNSNHPDMILDEVVLPSLATLQFLISGKAHQVMKSLKKIAFTKPQGLRDIKGGIYLPFSAFHMDAELTGFYVTHCYNYDIWNASEVPAPFSLMKAKLQNIIHRLKNNSSILPSLSEATLIMKPHSLEEKSFYAYLEHNQNSRLVQLDNDARIDLTVKTINELVVGPGRIPNVTMEQVESRFKTSYVKKHAGEIFNRNILKEITHLAISYTMMYRQVYVTLIGCEKENTIIGRLVAYGLENMEREQIIRLTNACSRMFNVCPMAINMDSAPPMSVESMTKLITKVKLKQDKQNRSSLWSQLPADWRKPVSLGEVAPKLDSGIEKITKSFEDRIGRIVFNVAQESFIVKGKGGEAFPDWQIVQYVLPSFVGSFVKKSQSITIDTKVNQLNYLKFLHQLLQLYEKRCKEWKRDCTPRQFIAITKEGREKDKRRLEEMRFLSLLYDEKIHPLFSFYTDSGQIAEAECVPGYEMLRNSLIHYTNSFFALGAPLYPDMHQIIKPWQEKSFYFLKNLYELCVQTWKPCMPGTPIPSCPKLGELYFAEAVIFELTYAYRITTLYTKAKPLQKLIRSIGLPICEMEKWKYILMKLALDPKRYSDNKANEFVKENVTKLEELYNNLKQYRTHISVAKFELVEHLVDYPPELKIAVQYYLEGNFVALDKMLTLFHTESVTPVLEKHRKLCRCCSRKEKRFKFIVCEKCIEDKYPDVNYFCSKTCQEARWKEEHMAEHLEFDLGLCDFSHLNLDN